MRLIDADKLPLNDIDNANHGSNYILIAETVKAIPVEKLEQVRDEIEEEVKFWSGPSNYNVESVVNVKNAKAQSYKHCLEIIDKALKEQNE